MTTLIAQIKMDQLVARTKGEKIRTKTLTCVLGDAQQLGKESVQTDDKVIAIVRKHMKNIDETLATLTGDGVKQSDEYKELTLEKNILMKYLPGLLDDEEVLAIARSVTDRLVNKGRIMGAVKQHCAKNDKLFDGNQVNRMIEVLTQELED